MTALSSSARTETARCGESPIAAAHRRVHAGLDLVGSLKLPQPLGPVVLNFTQSTQKFVGIKPVERFECVLGVEQLRFEADLLRIVQPHNRYLDIARMRLRHDLPCSG